MSTHRLNTALWPDAIERLAAPVELELTGWAVDGLSVQAIPFEPAELHLGAHPYPTGRGGVIDMSDPSCWIASCLRTGAAVAIAKTRCGAMELACECWSA